MLGFDDYCYPDSVVLVEWVDKIEPALQAVDYVLIELEHAGETKRKIHIKNIPSYIKC
jgi:tRNA A37 threonylcarbamoyladenosine biosynthesis protein TsaE